MAAPTTATVDTRERTVENPHAGTGSVLLDIGGDIGALVVHMPATMVGEEIEVHPADVDLVALREHDREHDQEDGHGHSHHHPHVAVVDRPTLDGPRPSLVYPGLSAGRWQLCEIGAVRAALVAEVSGGAVTELTWGS